MFTLIIVRIGLGVSVQESSGHIISAINTTGPGGSVKQISVRMTRVRQIQDDDQDHIVDIQAPDPCQESKLNTFFDNNNHDIDTDSDRVTSRPPSLDATDV